MVRLASLASTAALAALALSACADTGTETDNPVLEFESSECNAPASDYYASQSPVARSSAALSFDPALYNGLYCYAWEAHDDGVVTLDVLNYNGGCGAQYALADTRVERGSIQLGIINPTCTWASCDATCLFDFSYELAGVDTSARAELQLRRVACDDSSEERREPRVILPLDEQREGVLCRQVTYGAGAPTCGLAHTPPCGADYFGTCADGCGEGLACVEDALGDEDLCFTACEADEDCPLDIEACEDGACRLRETF